jgi:hypothetical protein
MDISIIASFAELLTPFAACFTTPSQLSFLTLAQAWVLASGPRTVTNLIRTAGPVARKSHDAYQYFFSGAVLARSSIVDVPKGSHPVASAPAE